ncbi:MAG TPA: PKD domain-containing protein [Terriglobales bacterium]|nr:PKD domain-containing protein [Terriglobales bacterium]
MQKFSLSLFLFVVALVSLTALGETPFHPTTTLAIETGNNTSAADGFAQQPNGNIASTNVSKVPTRSLLYPGATTKLYAHLVPWFGFGDHVEVGYNSADVLQVQKQVTDMISRGLDGVIIDWYGPGTLMSKFVSYDQATQAIMLEAEKHPGFTFAIMEDVGALKECGRRSGCDLTETLIDDLNYAHRTYEGSPAYMRYNDRPVVLFFGMTTVEIDWQRVRSRVAGNPLFIFRNSGAFVHQVSDGGYAWVSSRQKSPKGQEQAKDHTFYPGPGYLDGYYNSATRHKDELSLGAGFKGFDDSIALWSGGRYLDQQCGQTWLRSIAEAWKYYSAESQMYGIQMVTWNDYEEGTEFESGVENCVALAADAHGTAISWRTTGEESTIDHYTVFVSQDGENLMPLANTTTDTHSLELSNFGLDPGDYTVYVKAVGKPSLTNKMSDGERITIGPGSSHGNSGSTITLGVSPQLGTAPMEVTASVMTADSVQPMLTTIDFGDGTIITGQLAATHVYSLAGTYTVMATVTDVRGLISTRIGSVQITEVQ